MYDAEKLYRVVKNFTNINTAEYFITNTSDATELSVVTDTDREIYYRWDELHIGHTPMKTYKLDVTLIKSLKDSTLGAIREIGFFLPESSDGFSVDRSIGSFMFPQTTVCPVNDDYHLLHNFITALNFRRFPYTEVSSSGKTFSSNIECDQIQYTSNTLINNRATLCNKSYMSFVAKFVKDKTEVFTCEDTISFVSDITKEFNVSVNCQLYDLADDRADDYVFNKTISIYNTTSMEVAAVSDNAEVIKVGDKYISKDSYDFLTSFNTSLMLSSIQTEKTIVPVCISHKEGVYRVATLLQKP